MPNFAELADEIDAGPAAEQAAAAPVNFSDLADQINVTSKPTRAPDKSAEKGGYMEKIRAAWNRVGETVTPATLKPALGDAAMAAITGAPVALVKHGVEEGAYLSGQSPEQAARTAQRVIPTDGYQPVTPGGQAITELGAAVGQPLVDVGKWAAEKVGLSPAAQNLAGDLSAGAGGALIGKGAAAGGRVAGQAAGAAVERIGQSANVQKLADIGSLAKDIGRSGGLSEMQQRYRSLVEEGKAPPVQQQTGPTPQQLRGQEPMPENAVVPLRRPEAPPQTAPELTVKNASPELQAMIKESGSAPTSVEVTRLLEADSLPVRIRLSQGQASGDIHLLSDEFNKRGTPQGKPIADLYNQQSRQLVENIDAIRDRAAPDVQALDHVQNGEALIDAYKAKDATLQQDISAKYKALEDANGGAFPLDGKQFVDAADAALAKKLKSHYVPPEVRATLNDLREGGTMTFEDFETLRSDLAETARSAQDGKVRDAASIIRQQLEDLPLPAGAEHLKGLANEARSAAKARFDLLDSDPAYKASVNDSIAADKFVQKYIINGNKADLVRLREFLSDNPAAQQSIAAGTINYLKDQAGIVRGQGNFGQARYNKAVQSMKPKIEFLVDPITAQQIETLGNVARYTTEQPRGSFYNNSNTAVTAIRELATGGVEGAINAKTGGGYGVLKDIVTSGKQQKAAAESVKPGAGLKPKKR